MIYLDNAASSEIAPGVVEYLKQYPSKYFYGNPSSKHALAKKGKLELDEVRRLLKIVLNATEYSILFSSSATEAHNWLISSYQKHVTQILYFDFDHPSIVNTIKALHLKQPNALILQELEQIDIVDIEKLFKKIQDHPKSLICLTHVHSVTGVIYPVIEIAKLLKEKFPKVIIHIDGVQGFQKVPFKLQDSVIDSYVVSSHKIGGLPGTAPIYIKSLEYLDPIFFGGGHENGLRSSSYNLFSILSLKHVIQTIEQVKSQYAIQQKVANAFFESVHQNFKEIYTLEYPNSFSCSPYIFFFGIAKVPSDILMRFLEEEEIYISSSSACSSKQKETDFFKKISIPIQWQKNMLRVSTSPWTTQEDINNFIQTTSSISKRLQHIL